MNLSIRPDRTLVRAGVRSNRYVVVSFTAPRSQPRESRMPVNVAFVLDRSGSMAGENKFGLAADAVRQSLSMLREEDRFSLVVYDSEVDVLAASAHATRGAIDAALASLAAVGPRGSTDLCSGWMRGCEQVAQFVDEEQVSRVLLLTDGLANQGEVRRDVLARHASELRERGVTTSTFGVGADFDERLLRDMAHEGGGNFYFLQVPAQIGDMITSELGEALEVVIPRAAIEIPLPRGADAEVLNRFRSSRIDDGKVLRIELGDVVSAQEAEVVVRIQFPRREEGATVSAQSFLTGAGLGHETASDVISWTYASHRENDLQPRDVTVDRLVAALYATRARAEATEANRGGDFERAGRIIESTVRRIRQYAGNDPELNRTWRMLDDERQQYDQVLMSPMAMKAAFYGAETAWKGRPSGRARRSNPA
jgi:Ca-activated chloride channel family protein